MGETVQLTKGEPACSRAGEILSGKYRLERELGRGAMGTVWAAQHLTLGQRVAIKLIAAEHAQAAEARVRFSTEAKAAARLKSRHVVQVYDDGETAEGTPYIVMEYLEGETLEARLDRERELPLVDAVRITAQVARGLARAHAQGVVHRDLKPGNIFLARNDEDDLGWTAKVLDFGIAKVDEPTSLSTTKTGALLGTPLFMSPEQVRGASRVDARSDLYSLGVCFYNMVTGRYAFDGESFGDILVAICTDPLPELTNAAPGVSAAVGDWFRRCCARNPEDRFQSSDELVEKLQAAVGGSVVLVQRGAIPEELRGPSGTIRGHSAPLSMGTSALSTEDSGSFLVKPVTEAKMRTPRAAQSHSDASSVLTVHDAKLPEPSRGRRGLWLALAGAALLGTLGLGLGVLRRSAPAAQAPPGQDASPRALAMASPVTTPTAAPAVASPPNDAAPASEAPPSQPQATPAHKASTVAPRAAGARPRPTRAPRKKTGTTDLGF
jgi:serine/threonine-protein kinase